MNVDTTQIHYKFKPYLIGTITLEDPDSGIRTHQVWGERGLSPCVRTSNRIFVATYIHTYTHTYVHTHTHAYNYTCMQAHTHTYIHT